MATVPGLPSFRGGRGYWQIAISEALLDDDACEEKDAAKCVQGLCDVGCTLSEWCRDVVVSIGRQTSKVL